MVDNVDPRENVDEQLRVSGVSSSHTLDIVGYLRSAIQWLALLHLIDHFPHIHFDLPPVLGETIEPFWDSEQLQLHRDQLTDGHTARTLIEDVKATNQADGSCKAHHGRKATTAHMRRAHSFHDPERNWRDRGHSTRHGVIRRPGIPKYPSQVPKCVGEFLARTSRFRG